MLKNSDNTQKAKIVIDGEDGLDEVVKLFDKWLDYENIFEVLKCGRDELSHSNILAHLLNPNVRHGFGDKFLKEFLKECVKNRIGIIKDLTPEKIAELDLSDVKVYREMSTDAARRMDIVVISERQKLVFVIENKTYSSELENQLNDYRDYVLRTYGGEYAFVLAFLTPDCVKPSDPENWVGVGYNFVAETLENLLDDTLPIRTQVYVKDYVNIIRRHVMEDKQLRELCKKVYEERREFFDLIFENTCGSDRSQRDISDFIYSYLKKNADVFDIKLWADSSSNYIKFTPTKLQDIYGGMGKALHNKNKNLVMFDVQNVDNLCIKVIIQPVANEVDDPKRISVIEKAKAANWQRKSKKQIGDETIVRTDEIINKMQMQKIKENLLAGADIEKACETIIANLDNYIATTLQDIIKTLS